MELWTKKEGNWNGFPIPRIPDIPHNSIVIIMNQMNFSLAEIFSELRNRTDLTVYRYDHELEQYSHTQGAPLDGCIRVSGVAKNILPYMEMHVADNCNLNCKACTHFTPLFKEVGGSLESFVRDLDCLILKGIEPVRLRLLGGEPLLQKCLGNMIAEIRRRFGHTYIRLVTNGILLPRLDKFTIDAIVKNRVKIDISNYEPTNKMKEEITVFYINTKYYIE